VGAALRRDVLLVEFLGLPGAGKSELSRRVAGRLRHLALPVHEPSYGLAHGIGVAARRARKSARVARELALHPRSAARAASVLARSGQPSLACFGGVLFNWLLVTSLARKARGRRGLHLIDEGLAQGAWSIALEGRLEPAVELLACLPPALVPDLLVVVEASTTAVAGRLRSRPQHDSRLDSRLDTEPELFRRGQAVAARIQSVLGASVEGGGAARVLVLGNERPEDLDACAARLAALLESKARELGLLDGRALTVPGAPT